MYAPTSAALIQSMAKTPGASAGSGSGKFSQQRAIQPPAYNMPSQNPGAYPSPMQPSYGPIQRY